MSADAPAQPSPRATPFHVVPGAVVADMLNEDRDAVLDLVAETYRRHAGGRSVNPDSYFLRFPEKPACRIIALPAHLGGPGEIAGLKWISSFPDNRAGNLARASAVVILNDCETGYPIACLEGSLISAERTAASAALAAEALSSEGRTGRLAIVGCGLIARAVVAWLIHRRWRFERVLLHDADPREAARFAGWLEERTGWPVTTTEALSDATRDASLVLFATTAGAPHVPPDALGHRPTVLHLSLRDLGMPQILASQNVVDDIGHALKASTSLHLVEQDVGHRGFVHGTLADLLDGRLAPDLSRPRVFSPFGLGVLDIALGEFVLRRARETGGAVAIPDFFSHAMRWPAAGGDAAR